MRDPVQRPDRSTSWTHSENGSGNGLRAVLPRVHTPYDYDEVLYRMIESDIMVDSALHVRLPKEELNQVLGVVARGVSTRTAVLVLSGILLRAEGGKLHLAATDMELSLRATIAAQVEGDGAIVLPGRTLVDIARLLPGDEVTI